MFVFDLTKNNWTNVVLKSPVDILPRDYHALSSFTNGGGFFVFGGFVKGSRVNELLKFTH